MIPSIMQMIPSIMRMIPSIMRMIPPVLYTQNNSLLRVFYLEQFCLVRSAQTLVQCKGRKKRFVKEDPITGEKVNISQIDVTTQR